MFDFLHWMQAFGPLVGYIIVGGVIFAETGLFFGFFLPGDSILFPAGLLASQGFFNIYVLCTVAFLMAVLGNIVGYYFGKNIGKRIFSKESSFFFRKNHIVRARAFYNKHGGKTIILARFIPIIRTFGPIVAGVSEMNFLSFVGYSVVGALFWAIGLPVAGYYLGRIIPDVDKYLLPIILLIIVMSIAPALIEILKTKEQRTKLLAYLLKKKN